MRASFQELREVVVFNTEVNKKTRIHAKQKCPETFGAEPRQADRMSGPNKQEKSHSLTRANTNGSLRLTISRQCFSHLGKRDINLLVLAEAGCDTFCQLQQKRVDFQASPPKM